MRSNDIIVTVALLISFSLILHPVIFEQDYPTARELFFPIVLVLLTISHIVIVIEKKEIVTMKNAKLIRITISALMIIVAVLFTVERFFWPFFP